MLYGLIFLSFYTESVKSIIVKVWCFIKKKKKMNVLGVTSGKEEQSKS